MRNAIYLFIFYLTASKLAAQDFHFVNSFQLPQIINPAAIGSVSVYRTHVGSLYRGQWEQPASKDSYQGAAVLADMRYCLPNSRKNFYALGLGIQHDYSPLGGLYNSKAMLTAAYHQHLGKDNFIAAGLSTGLLGFGLQAGRLRFDAQYQQGNYDPSRNNGEENLVSSIIRYSLGAGLLVYNNDRGWSIGMSWKHLNKPNYSLLGEDNRQGIGMIAHATYTPWQTRSHSRLWQLRALYLRQAVPGSNSLQWQALAGNFFQLAIGDSGGRLGAGLYIRTGGTPDKLLVINTLVPALQLSNGRYTGTLTYDIDLARTRAILPGGLELQLAASFGGTDRCVVCAKF